MPEKRWERVQGIYGDDRRIFNEDDKRDSGEKFTYGQRVTDSFKMSDIVLLNNNLVVQGNENDKLFSAKIKEKVDLIEKKIPFRPSATETHMAMAYATSMRSSCLKRKVGAVIADSTGNVFSSGYNEVPIANKTCLYPILYYLQLHTHVIYVLIRLPKWA